MRYAALYQYSNGQTSDAISVHDLAGRICAFHPDVGAYNFVPVELDPEVSLGHLKYERDRDSPYEGPFRVANIRYDKTLNRCWTRFVCCKELMHVFDSAEERVDDRNKFLKLMKEFESIPMKADISPMFASELSAEWMAVIVLCPKRLRDVLRPQWLDKTLSNYDVALRLKIPEVTIKSLMDDYYDTALAELLEK
jgi:hypothetical protein